MGASSIRCSKARSGTPKNQRATREVDGKEVLAHSSNSTLPTRNGPAAPGSIRLEQKGATHLGDFNMIDGTDRADHRAWTKRRRPPPNKACARGARRVRSEILKANVAKPCARSASSTSMKIADPDGKAKHGAIDGVLPFPLLSPSRMSIVVDFAAERQSFSRNDNNLPFSSSRDPRRPKHNRARPASGQGPLLDARSDVFESSSGPISSRSTPVIPADPGSILERWTLPFDDPGSALLRQLVRDDGGVPVEIEKTSRIRLSGGNRRGSFLGCSAGIRGAGALQVYARAG
ncbi:hypothetical protein FQR65_LT21002 [Abscondita terminalis]|nr:hypothetical protein FQR65_LT21002 [Abscondita terminalis]